LYYLTFLAFDAVDFFALFGALTGVVSAGAAGAVCVTASVICGFTGVSTFGLPNSLSLTHIRMLMF
jgi:hypothetical protein